jgi:hypothetical protein
MSTPERPTPIFPKRAMYTGPSFEPASLLNRLLGSSLAGAEPSLALGNLLVELGVVALGHLLLLLGLGLLLGGGRLGGGSGLVLFGGGGLDVLTLLANVGLLALGVLGLGVGNDVLLVDPELLGQPDGQGDRLGALDVDASDVAPLVGHPLAHEGGDDGVDVGGNLLGGPVGPANLDGSVCGRGQADEGRGQGLFDLLGDLSGGGGVDGALNLGALGLLAFGGLGLAGLQDNRDGTLLGGLEEGLAEDLGQAVDDAVVAEEDVVLGKELALGLVLAKLGLDVGKVDDTGDALAQLSGELVRGDNVLVGALGVRGDEADGGRLVRVERVRQGDLAGLQAGLVGNVALGGQVEPDGLGRGLGIVLEQVALGRLAGLLLRGLLDVREEGLGRLEGL